MFSAGHRIIIRACHWLAIGKDMEAKPPLCLGAQRVVDFKLRFFDEHRLFRQGIHPAPKIKRGILPRNILCSRGKRSVPAINELGNQLDAVQAAFSINIFRIIVFPCLYQFPPPVLLFCVTYIAHSALNFPSSVDTTSLVTPLFLPAVITPLRTSNVAISSSSHLFSGPSAYNRQAGRLPERSPSGPDPV